MIDTYRDDFLQYCLHLMGVRLVICRLDLTLVISFIQFLLLRDENSDICVTGVVRLGLQGKSKFRTYRLFKVSSTLEKFRSKRVLGLVLIANNWSDVCLENPLQLLIIITYYPNSSQNLKFLRQNL